MRGVPAGRIACLIAVGLAASALVGTQPVSGEAVANGAPAPATRILAKMDRQLLKVIHKLQAHSYSDFPKGDVGRIENERLALVDRFFARRVYGVKFSDVFVGLDCLDRGLEHGRGIGFGFAQKFTPPEDKRIATSFAAGATCLHSLVAELHLARAVPGGLVGTVARMGRQLAKVLHKLQAHRYDYFPKSDVGKIESQGIALATHFYAQPVYGVPLSDVFGRLDCLDRNIAYGHGVASAFGHDLASGPDGLIASSFQAGMRCKQALETELHP